MQKTRRKSQNLQWILSWSCFCPEVQGFKLFPTLILAIFLLPTHCSEAMSRSSQDLPKILQGTDQQFHRSPPLRAPPLGHRGRHGLAPGEDPAHALQRRGARVERLQRAGHRAQHRGAGADDGLLPGDQGREGVGGGRMARGWCGGWGGEEMQLP